MPSDNVPSTPAGSAGFPWLVLLATIAMDAVAILPAALVGVLALDIAEDLDVSTGRTGVLVATYFLTGSVVAAALGPHIDRVGPRKAATVAAGGTAGALALGAVPWDAWWGMAVACAVGGGAMSVTMPSTNAVLGAVVQPSRRIVAVCAKQAAVPVALTVAAAAIPVASVAGGWRVVFAGASALGVAVLVFFRRFVHQDPPVASATSAPASESRRAQRAILRVGIAAMLASMLAGTLAGYTTISLDDAGLSPALVATVLAVSNAGGILTRLLTGWWAQRRGSVTLRPVGLMMIAGGLGSFLMTAGSPVAVTIGTIMAFSLGWGWSALTYAVMLELNSEHPGATGAVVQSGGMAGSGAGPLVMASFAESLGLGAGWAVVGSAAAAGGILIWSFREPDRKPDGLRRVASCGSPHV